MKKLLVVEDAFQIKGRGLVVVPGPLASEMFPIPELDAELRYASGSTRMVRVRVQPVFQTPPARIPQLGVIFPFLAKADVPVGTEVWCIPKPLDADSIANALATVRFDEPWRSVSGGESEKLEQELARELASGHALYERVVSAVARRIDCDDVLFLVRSPTAALVQVHLTWSSESNPSYPHVSLFESVAEWMTRVQADIEAFS